MFRVTGSGNVTTETETDVCTYTFNNGAIAITDSDATTVSGSITGSTLRVTVVGGKVWIYEK